MNLSETIFAGAQVLRPTVHYDHRGYFFESYHHQRDRDLFPFPFLQDNESFSTRGVLRGLHYQLGESAQGKLIRVLRGKIFAVAVDLRPNVQTYLKHFTLELDDVEKQQLWIPRGFAHGHLVLSDEALVSYRCDNYYDPLQERGLRWDDPSLGIDWPLPSRDIQTSPKDAAWPLLKSSCS